MSLAPSDAPSDDAWRRRLPTTSGPGAPHRPPPARLLRARNPHTLFFDFRAHPALAPTDILRILTDPELAHSDAILGITFHASHRLAQVVFRHAEAVRYHREEARSADADVSCWDAIHVDRPVVTVWLRGTPIADPRVLEFWVRDAMERVLPRRNDVAEAMGHAADAPVAATTALAFPVDEIDLGEEGRLATAALPPIDQDPALHDEENDEDGWRVHDVRLQFYPGTNVLTDSVAVSLVLPRPPDDTSSDEVDVGALLAATLPRRITVGDVRNVQLTWAHAPPHCSHCNTPGHTLRHCPAVTSTTTPGLVSPSSSRASSRHRRGRRGTGSRTHTRRRTLDPRDESSEPVETFSSTSSLLPPSSDASVSNAPSLLALPSAAATSAHPYSDNPSVLQCPPPVHHPVVTPETFQSYHPPQPVSVSGLLNDAPLVKESSPRIVPSALSSLHPKLPLTLPNARSLVSSARSINIVEEHGAGAASSGQHRRTHSLASVSSAKAQELPPLPLVSSLGEVGSGGEPEASSNPATPITATALSPRRSNTMADAFKSALAMAFSSNADPPSTSPPPADAPAPAAVPSASA